MMARFLPVLFVVSVLCFLPSIFCQRCKIVKATTECQKANSSGASISTNCILSLKTFVPKPRSYEVRTVSSTGLVPFYKLSKSITGIVAKSPPWEVYQSLIAGRGVKQALNTLVAWDKTHFFITLGFGVLWALLALFGGIIFCCCRCCKQCGARTNFLSKPSDVQTRFFLTLGIGLTACFLLGSATIMYLTNTRIGEAVGLFQSVLNTSLDRIAGFTLDAIEELGFLTFDQIPFLVDQLLLQVVQLGNEVASVGLDTFRAPVNATAEQVLKLSSSATAALSALQSIKVRTQTLKALRTNISMSLMAAQLTCGSRALPACTNVNNQLTTAQGSLVTYTFPSVDTHITSVQGVVNRNLGQQVANGVAKFEQIPCDIISRTASIRASVASEVNKSKTTIDTSLKPILESLNLSSLLDIYSLKSTTEGIANTVKRYDLYRQVAGYLLGSFSLVVVLLIVGGMTCGCCGYTEGSKATHRSVSSHIGSMAIMSGVYAAIFFTFFLMLLCAITFYLGGHMSLVCPSLRSKEFFSQTFDDVPKTKSSYFLGSILHKNGSFNLTLRSVLEKCEKNSSSFEALQFGKQYNLTTLLDPSKITKEIDSQLTSLTQNFNLDANSFLTPEARTSLTDFNTSGIQTINTTAILIQARQTQLSNVTIASANTQYASAIAAAKMAAQPLLVTAITTSQNHFWYAANKSQEISQVVTLLARDVDTLQNISSTLSNTISSVLTNADNLTATIKDFTLSFGNRTVRKYGDRLKSWITTFFTFAQNFIATKAANCRPVHTIYEGVVDYLCDFTVDTMNGFWLSCGWACFFFVPAIIMGTCLERFYRRMTYEEGFDTNEEGFQHSPGTELRELQYSDPQKC
eukprot:scpid24368/ scgid33172/ Prominin-1; Antigen AC133; Prominin-like protein 1